MPREIITAEEAEQLQGARTLLKSIEQRLRYDKNFEGELNGEFVRGFVVRSFGEAQEAVFDALNSAASHGDCENARAALNKVLGRVS